MRKISRMLIALIAGGLMVASTQASMVILNNPHGLDLNGFTGDGSESWDWASDTLETAYDNGQVDILSPTFVSGGVTYSAIWNGDATNLMDGVANQNVATGVLMYNQFQIQYTLNAGYDGPRALGTVDGQYGHAMRIAVSYHESYNNYHMTTYYQTTDAPGVWNTLFEVEDLDTDPNWRQSVVYVYSDAASEAIDNISAISIQSYVVEQGNPVGSSASYGGMIMEMDVNLVPEPASMVLVGLGGLGFAFLRRFRV